MRLVRAEWSRLFARRFTRVMILVVLALFAVIVTSAALDSQRPTEASRATARVQAAEEQRRVEQLRTECEAARSRGEDVSDRYIPNCDYGRLDFSEENFLRPQFNFRQEMPDYLFAAAGLFVLFGFLVGASFVGAEWTSGGMSNLLLWRPRRIVVLATKLFTALAGLFVTTAALLAAYTGSFWLIARYRGTFGGLTRGFWESLALTGGRAVALGLVAAAGGFAIASLGRHTATALGVGIGYAVVVEIGAQLFLRGFRVANPERYALSSYMLAWMQKRYELPPVEPFTCTGGTCAPPAGYVLTYGMSAAVVGTILLALLLLTFTAMHRRDVT